MTAAPGERLDRDEKPLAVIAAGLGVTKQRAGQIHLQALAALRKALGEQARAVP